MKKCTVCGQEKPIEAFPFANKARGIRHAKCKVCKNLESKKYSVPWYERNVEAALAKQKERRTRNKLTVLQHYSNGDIKCSCQGCSERRIEFMCIDHIGGGGNKHRKEIGRGTDKIYFWLIENNFPEGFRVLCLNCNGALGSFGYCPHQKE